MRLFLLLLLVSGFVFGSGGAVHAQKTPPTMQDCYMKQAF
jgi:hypothetical protein